ncbi:uncharacterized protein L199_003816 [Kwoniella botswanensis]|uniref:uncharacterized protein n=1 Tax=Kwoniella botswanensis TaxID=1268659 RepID=UPI00315DDD6A
MTFLTILLTLLLPVIGSCPLPIPTYADLNSAPLPECSGKFATRAEESGGGGGIGIGAIAGIIIAVLAIILIILFIYIHNRRRNSIPNLSSAYGSPPPAYTSPPTKIYYPSQKHYPTLPKYTGPNTSPAYVPSSGGRTEGGERGVRFGGVGVRGYN